MHRPIRRAIAAAALPAVLSAAVLAAPAGAEGADPARIVETTIEAPYEDVLFDLRIAIEGRGLVIDAVSHVGEMLNRTAADVGAATQVYDHAEVTQFCSATVSRRVMEANPFNLAYCPYGIFTFQLAGEEGVVHIGFRRYPEGEMQEVEALLDSIMRETAGIE